MTSLAEQFGKDYIKKFKVLSNQTLFEIDWSVLKRLKCPLCLHKLYPTRRGVYLCRSPLHKRPFVISTPKLNKIIIS